ncbi:MAG TPA: LppP/LprE family lipoprotein [Thermomicrobiales bacterium]|nr:LppP/LprE family lipoprotein [Thermomicrobiales bacterium]
MRASVLSLLTAFAIILPPMVSSPTFAQEESWLDGNLASWNTPGMALPSAPTIEGNPDPRCVERERPAETEEDDALLAKNWRHFLPYQRGWGVTLILGLSGYDGMCRPLGYQSFVFVDSVSAGTVSPEPMASRTTGAAPDVHLLFADRLSAEYLRYAPDDPLCCASGTDSVQFTIEDTPDRPVLNPLPPS